MFQLSSYSTNASMRGIFEYLDPVQEVLNVLTDLFPKSSYPQICLLRISFKLLERQHCHMDNKKFHLECPTIRMYEDVSFSCFFGLEESTYLGLASFDYETKRLEREMVHIPPGAMLIISGNKIHYGSMYRGSSTLPDSYPAQEHPCLLDNVRCATFINPKYFHTDKESQLWFLDGQEPRSIPHNERLNGYRQDDEIINNQTTLHSFSNN